MRTWSAEELFVRAYAAGAVAAQGVWDLVKGVERITKPPRRSGGFDEDAAGEYLACSPNGYYGLVEPDLGGSICGTQHFGSKARHQCACILAADQDCQCAEAAEPEHFKAMTLDDVVAQLCQLTYFVEDLRNIIQDSPAASTAGDPSPIIASAAPQCAVGDEGSSADSGIPLSPAGERTKRESLYVLATFHITKHRRAVPWPGSADDPRETRCQCGAVFHWAGDWSRHVGETVIDAVLERQAPPAFPEAGIVIADRLTGASEFYPQHRKTK